MRNSRASWYQRRALGVVAGWLMVACHPLWSQQLEDQPAGEVPEPGGYLWGALVRASNVPAEGESKPLDEGLVQRLGAVFEYAHFQLIGEHKQPVSSEYETWLMPSKEFYMKVDSKGPLEGGLGLHLQLWRGENVILKTDVILSAGSPVFIAGPKWGDDQLLFVVLLREEP